MFFPRAAKAAEAADFIRNPVILGGAAL